MSATETRAAEVASRRGRRFFYGWWIVAVSALGMLVLNGIGFYSFSAFLPQFAREFGDRAAISFAATIFAVGQGVTGPLVGWAADRLGPRLLMPLGAAVAGLALLGMSRISAIWQLYFGHFFLAAGLSGLSMVVIGPTLASWFVRRRAFAIGLAASFLSLGGTVFVPLDTLLIGRFEWRGALVALAFVVWLGVMPASALVMRRRPAELGLHPDGDPAAPAATRSHRPEPKMPVGQVLRTGAFRSITAGLVLLFFCQSGLLLHQISFLTDHGFTAAEGALAIGVTTLTSTFGRAGLGLIADRISKKHLAAGCMMLQAGAILLMTLVPSAWAIYPAMLAIGVTIAAFGLLQPLLMAEFFGIGNLGTLLGSAAIFISGITGFGAVFAGYLREATGTYDPAFLSFAALELIAAIVIFQARRPAALVPAAPRP
jgi:MFS family permease